MPMPLIRWAVWLASGTAALSLGLMAPRPAGARVPWQGEFQVNTYTTSAQNDAHVATDADGDFVVVWTSIGSSGTDPYSSSIQGQRFSSNGLMQGAQFQVNTDTTSDQGDVSVVADADGDFVVVWQSSASPTDTSGYSVHGRRYASDGSPKGAQFQVNVYTTNHQTDPSVAMDADGDFVVVWTSDGSSGTDTSFNSIQGRRYASDGSTQAAEFLVNTYTTHHQFAASVAAGADGDFVVVWTSAFTAGTDSGSSIQGQRFASDGSTRGAQFQVNTYTTNSQYHPVVAANADGDFVVAWESRGSFGTDTSFDSIQGQRYASDGSTRGAEFQVNTYTTNVQTDQSVAVAADDSFVVVWTTLYSWGPDLAGTVAGQRYASDGSSLGPQFQINTYATYTQTNPSVAAEPDGDFIVTWESLGSFGTDTSSWSIQGRRYLVTAAVPSMSPATRSALATVLLLLGAACALRAQARAERPPSTISD